MFALLILLYLLINAMFAINKRYCRMLYLFQSSTVAKTFGLKTIHMRQFRVNFCYIWFADFTSTNFFSASSIGLTERISNCCESGGIFRQEQLKQFAESKNESSAMQYFWVVIGPIVHQQRDMFVRTITYSADIKRRFRDVVLSML